MDTFKNAIMTTLSYLLFIPSFLVFNDNDNIGINLIGLAYAILYFRVLNRRIEKKKKTVILNT